MLKRVAETVQNEVKEKKEGVFSVLLGALGSSLWGNILTGRGAITKSQGRGINRAEKGRRINRADEGIVKAGYCSLPLKCIFNAASSFN